MNNKLEDLEVRRFVGSPTDEEMAVIQAYLPSRLPGDFVDFLAVANGGNLPYLIEISNGKDTEKFAFSSIYSTKRVPNRPNKEYFIDELLNERRDNELPIHLLPFAQDGGGSVLYVDVSDDDYGAIRAAIRGLPGWTGLAGEDRFVRIADGILDYVNRLIGEDG